MDCFGFRLETYRRWKTCFWTVCILARQDPACFQDIHKQWSEDEWSISETTMYQSRTTFRFRLAAWASKKYIHELPQQRNINQLNYIVSIRILKDVSLNVNLCSRALCWRLLDSSQRLRGNSPVSSKKTLNVMPGNASAPGSGLKAAEMVARWGPSPGLDRFGVLTLIPSLIQDVHGGSPANPPISISRSLEQELHLRTDNESLLKFFSGWKMGCEPLIELFLLKILYPPAQQVITMAT